jgi:hypothetical protein
LEAVLISFEHPKAQISESLSLVSLFKQGGMDAFVPQSVREKTQSNKTRIRIIPPHVLD